ncbi:AAA family ATPase [Marinomonas algicola]|uniref:AAA family ATPase n=1 Tax=Marinomonas algicola TaxID=2773454 RepID=UPI00174C75DD|nr:hypothetical protein [Marinomonas algicola]
MFDLVDILKNSRDTQEEDSSRSGPKTAFFFQTSECRSLVEETYRFDDKKIPKSVLFSFDLVANRVTDDDCEIAIFELTDSDTLAEDAERLSHIIPSSVSVIIIGLADSISTVRMLKSLGFYYVFWPINKQELSEFLAVITKKHQEANLGNIYRRAKRIAVFGTKGGVGASLIAAELASALSVKKKSDSLLVNHNYDCGDLDIQVGNVKLDKKSVAKGTLTTDLDETSVKSLMMPLNSKLRYLALAKDQLQSDEVREVTDMVISLTSSEANLIVEDLSASVSFDRTPEWLIENFNILILVLEPSVSSLRESVKLIKRIRNIQNNSESKKNLRIIVIVNHHRHKKMETVSIEEISKYLSHKVDYELPYEENIALDISKGKRVIDSGSRFSQNIIKLSSQIVGENKSFQKKKSYLSRLLSKKKSTV